MTARLFTIPLSHYAERARWALDLAQLEYLEEQHLQVFSWLVAFRVAAQKLLPVLITEEGRTLNSSRLIARYASARAKTPFATEEQSADAAFEDELANNFGEHTRRVAYDWFFALGRVALPYNAGRAPLWQVQTLDNILPAARAFMKRYFQLDTAHLTQAHSEVLRTLDSVAARLADGRPYLTGDTLSSLDITFASMAAPVLLPEGFPVPYPPPHRVRPEDKPTLDAYRNHPAGAFALRLYRERAPSTGQFLRPLYVKR